MTEYQRYFNDMCDRVNKVINDKWPASLKTDFNPFTWAREECPDLMATYDKQADEVNSLWLNNSPFEAFKGACIEWGRTVIEIYRKFACSIREAV